MLAVINEMYLVQEFTVVYGNELQMVLNCTIFNYNIVLCSIIQICYLLCCMIYEQTHIIHALLS
jgi:hypothetical protein